MEITTTGKSVIIGLKKSRRIIEKGSLRVDISDGSILFTSTRDAWTIRCDISDVVINDTQATTENIEELSQELFKYASSEETGGGISQVQALIDDAIDNLMNGVPDALDTLKELSDALGGDPNFATTVLTKIAEKSNKATLGVASLPVDSWVASGDEFKATVSDNKIVDNTVVIFSAARADMELMKEAQVSSLPDMAIGSFTVYAKKKPTAAISLNYSILH